VKTIINYLLSFMRGKNHIKIAGIVIFLAVTVTIWFFEGRTTGWAPRHIMIGHITLDLGYLPEYGAVNRSPGFYAIVAIIFAITDLSKYQFLFFPVLLLPVIVTMFAVLRRFSEDIILSSLLVVGILISGLDGLNTLYIGGHGLGRIMLWSTVLLLTVFLQSKEYEKKFFLAIIVIFSSLNYISYNKSAEFMLLTFWLLIFSYLVYKYKLIEVGHDWLYNRAYHLAAVLIIIAIAVQVHIHTFLEGFLGFFAGVITENRSGLDLILEMYFESSTGTSPVGDLIISSPSYATELAIIRYLAIVIILLIFVYLTVIKMFNKKYFPGDWIVVASFVSALATFAIIRMSIGHVAVTYAFVPAIFVAACLYKHSHKYEFGEYLRFILIAFSIVIIIQSSLYYGVHLHNNSIDHEASYNDELQISSYWLDSHLSDEIVTDEFSSNMLRLYSDDRIDSSRMEREEPLFILDRNGNPTSQYYYINYDVEEVRLGHWQKLQSWSQEKNTINNNEELNKIYSTESNTLMHSN
jgi:hypothetical protein